MIDDDAGLSSAASRLTLRDVLANQARSNPDRIAASDDARSLTYAELDAVTNRLANGLCDFGVGRGALVAILGANSLEHVLIQHAVAKLGAGLAVLNWRQTPDELAHAISLAQPRAIFAQQPHAESVVGLGRPVIRLNAGGSPELDRRFIDPFPPTPPEAHVDAEDIVTVLYTSGTTGRPKAAAVSQRAMIARASFAAAEMGLTRDDAHLAWAPMCHLVSADYVFICAVLGSRYIVVDGFDVEAINSYVHQVQLGWLVLMPGTIDVVIERLKADDQPAAPVRCVGAMADLVPPAKLAELTRLLGAPYYNSYGMTESGPLTTTFIAPGDTPETLGKRLTAYVSSRLVDPAGASVEPGTPGELLVAGPTVFSGYLRDPAATKAALAGGWYHSGDLLRADETGLLHFVGRSKYLIKSGGENIYPAEIERVLFSFPEVTEAVVVGKRDPHWGETPVAFVAADAPVDAETLKAECRRQLAGYKVPRDIITLPFDEFPRNVTGKVMRPELEKKLHDQASQEPQEGAA